MCICGELMVFEQSRYTESIIECDLILKHNHKIVENFLDFLFVFVVVSITEVLIKTELE